MLPFHSARNCFLLASVILVLASNHSARASDDVTWPAAIRNVELLLEQYLETADELLRQQDEYYASGNYSPLSYNGKLCANCYWPEHQCAILGRMLGKTGVITHLEAPLPSLSSSLESILSAADSLDQWLFTANRLLEASEAERANIWNLECVGSFSISLEEYDPRGEGSISFQLDGPYLWIYGDVVEGFYEQLTSVLDAHPEVQIIAIGSAGGSVRDAVLAGSEIRLRGLSTQLSGPCMSACPLVFMGGVSRYVMRPYPAFGFHQVSDDNGAIPFDDPTYDVVVEYADVMGVSGDWVLQQFVSASPEDINIVGDTQAERDDLCRNGLVTFYQGIGSTVC